MFIDVLYNGPGRVRLGVSLNHHLIYNVYDHRTLIYAHDVKATILLVYMDRDTRLHDTDNQQLLYTPYVAYCNIRIIYERIYIYQYITQDFFLSKLILKYSNT